MRLFPSPSLSLDNRKISFLATGKQKAPYPARKRARKQDSAILAYVSCMSERLTFKDAGAAIGKSGQSVRDLVNRGVLTDCVWYDAAGKAVGVLSLDAFLAEREKKVRGRAGGVGRQPVMRAAGKPLRPASERMASVLDRAPESTRVMRRSEEIPDYNESRAKTEFERANLLELERKQKEGLLLPVDQVERVWANSITIAKTKLLAVPSRLRQRIPHLTLEEIAIAEGLIRECLEELASGEGKDAD